MPAADDDDKEKLKKLEARVSELEATIVALKELAERITREGRP